MKLTVWLCAGVLLASLPQGSAMAADKTPDAAKADRIEALRRLDSTDVKMRRRAVEQLATAGQMADVPDLLASLDDDDSVVRAGAERAVWAIWSRSGDPEVDRLFAEGSDHLAHRRLVPGHHAPAEDADGPRQLLTYTASL